MEATWRPDGDCIGSELAVAYALKHLGKKVTVLNQDEMPEKLAFLDPKKILSSPKKTKTLRLRGGDRLCHLRKNGHRVRGNRQTEDVDQY